MSVLYNHVIGNNNLCILLYHILWLGSWCDNELMHCSVQSYGCMYTEVHWKEISNQNHKLSV